MRAPKLKKITLAELRVREKAARLTEFQAAEAARRARLAELGVKLITKPGHTM